MSGIAGYVCLDGREADRAELQVMLRTLAHRGPDGEGLWCGRHARPGAPAPAHHAGVAGETLPLVARGAWSSRQTQGSTTGDELIRELGALAPARDARTAS
jgi:asparagine synthetase B (glutamine-hydrolysing)